KSGKATWYRPCPLVPRGTNYVARFGGRCQSRIGLNKFLTVGKRMCYITHPLVTESPVRKMRQRRRSVTNEPASRRFSGWHLSPLRVGALVCLWMHGTLTSVHTE